MDFERSKGLEYREESKLLNEQIEQFKDSYMELRNSVGAMKNEVQHHTLLLGKMDECKAELKQTLLNSLICLDFYKDLECYISEHRFQSPLKEVSMHFDVISDLI